MSKKQKQCESEKSTNEGMLENIRAEWEDIKTGRIKPFYESVFLMFHIVFLLSESGYIDGLLDQQIFFTVWQLWKKSPNNKMLKQAMIEEFDIALKVSERKD